jgi:hypothetical protein
VRVEDLEFLVVQVAEVPAGPLFAGQDEPCRADAGEVGGEQLAVGADVAG